MEPENPTVKACLLSRLSALLDTKPPADVDIFVSECDDVRYRLQGSAAEPQTLLLSVALPPMPVSSRISAPAATGAAVSGAATGGTASAAATAGPGGPNGSLPAGAMEAIRRVFYDSVQVQLTLRLSSKLTFNSLCCYHGSTGCKTSLWFTRASPLPKVDSCIVSLLQVLARPEAGYNVTLLIDFSKLPELPEAKQSFIAKLASIRAVIMGAGLRKLLLQTSEDGGPGGYGVKKPIEVVLFRAGEVFFALPEADRVTVVFPMQFSSNEDAVRAVAFFQVRIHKVRISETVVSILLLVLVRKTV